jgi:hypothetical protein
LVTRTVASLLLVISLASWMAAAQKAGLKKIGFITEPGQ